jgi:cysteinyl-tRNA synthetase
MDGVLGVLGRNARPGNAEGLEPDVIRRVESLMAERAAARASKQWRRSDQIREELSALGIVVRDGPNGATWSRAMSGD